MSEEAEGHLEDCLDQIALVIDGYSWLGEGRGPYRYDDPRYDDDVRTFVAALQELLPPSKSLGWEEMLSRLNALTRERDELWAALEAAAEKFQRIQWVALPSTMVMARAMDGEQAVRDALDTLTNKAAGGKEA